jgi:hypothetical protein
VYEGVHEGALAYVGCTYYSNRDASLKGIASAEGVGKLLDVPIQRINELGKFCAVGKLYVVVVGEVEFEFEKRGDG